MAVFALVTRARQRRFEDGALCYCFRSEGRPKGGRGVGSKVKSGAPRAI